MTTLLSMAVGLLQPLVIAVIAGAGTGVLPRLTAGTGLLARPPGRDPAGRPAGRHPARAGPTGLTKVA
jgi:hypothetical protein